MQEQRNFQRFELDGKAEIRTAAQDMSIEAFLENLSFGGAGLVLSESISVGSLMSFAFTTQFMEKPLTGTGVVRHLRPVDGVSVPQFRLGLEFHEIDKDAVVFLIGRIQTRISDSLRARGNIRPVDYIPY